jgi:hypothetical protein
MKPHQQRTAGLRFLLTTTLLLSFLLTSRTDAWAKWKRLPDVPVERLIENVTRYIKERPNEVRGYYTLGRLHSYAFSRPTETVGAYQQDQQGLLKFAPYEPLVQKREVGWKLSEAHLQHLRESIINYRKAIELDSQEPLSFFGLGWMLEEGSAFALEVGIPPGFSVIKTESFWGRITGWFRNRRYKDWISKLGATSEKDREEAFRNLRSEINQALPVLLEARTEKNPQIRSKVGQLLSFSWKQQALDAYRRAYALSIEKDLRTEVFGPSDPVISLEAAQGILRILEVQEKTPDIEREIKQVKESVAAIQAKPRAITPIIFSLERPVPLKRLLTPNHQVAFDLDGSGERLLWPWVKPRTGILVWDPAGAGRIESGRELFGSVTWWMFWPTGYDALAALDDDGDGWLSGSELKGLAVWRDRNQNGVSEPGEVIPVEALGIARLATQATSTEDGAPCNLTGLHLTSGLVLPTYDWTPGSTPKSSL